MAGMAKLPQVSKKKASPLDGHRDASEPMVADSTPARCDNNINIQIELRVDGEFAFS
jgi:hypothetical protein